MTDYNAMSDDALSREVAVRVMEWKLSPAKAWWCPPDSDAIAVQDWRPAADWSDMGRVIEKMRADGWVISVEQEPGEHAFVGFYYHADLGTVTAEAYAPTIHRAACIAALRAAGREG